MRIAFTHNKKVFLDYSDHYPRSELDRFLSTCPQRSVGQAGLAISWPKLSFSWIAFGHSHTWNSNRDPSPLRGSGRQKYAFASPPLALSEA